MEMPDASEKRKRSPTDIGMGRSVGSSMLSGVHTQINYFFKPSESPVRLLNTTPETFDDILGLIEDYEGILQRNESLAANLGATLAGPSLFKSFDKLFKGSPIIVLQKTHVDCPTISWLDIVEFAKTRPQEFILNDDRLCQFWIKGSQVQISDDDYWLILSGAPERMIPSHPLPKDELTESATIDILDTRLTMLVKKADAVAGRARKLNYHLSARRNMIKSRQPVSTPQGSPSFPSSSFNPVNVHLITGQITGEPLNLHSDLLRQFDSVDKKLKVVTTPRVKPPRTGSEATKIPASISGNTPDELRRASIRPSADLAESRYKPIMSAKVERLGKNESIWPPCDRCRRLNYQCRKHLTACVDCTNKHAKCDWKTITPEEATMISPKPETTNGNASGHVISTINQTQSPSTEKMPSPIMDDTNRN